MNQNFLADARLRRPVALPAYWGGVDHLYLIVDPAQVPGAITWIDRQGFDYTTCLELFDPAGDRRLGSVLFCQRGPAKRRTEDPGRRQPNVAFGFDDLRRIVRECSGVFSCC